MRELTTCVDQNRNTVALWRPSSHGYASTDSTPYCFAKKKKYNLLEALFTENPNTFRDN